MNIELNKILEKFFKENQSASMEEINVKLQKLLEDYNKGEIDYETTPLELADEILDKAYQCKSKKESLKLAKEAFAMSDACFDAILLQVDLAKGILNKEKILNDGLAYEKERLTKEGFFKDYMGSFYSAFETRPYMRGLSKKSILLARCSKYTQAINECKEILTLNKNDNLGIRFLLMFIYAFLEDEKALKALIKKYPSNSLDSLFPLFLLYYKLGQEKEANIYLEKINQANPNFVKLFKGTIKADDAMPGTFRIGYSSEVFMVFQNYGFLIYNIVGIDEYILDYFKKKKKE